MGIDNFFFGVQAIFSGLVDTVRILFLYRMFWGFVLGILVSTILHAFLFAEKAKHIPAMVLNDTAVSFQKLYQKTDGSFDQSFAVYAKNVQHIKMTFYICAIIVTLVLVLIANPFA